MVGQLQFNSTLFIVILAILSLQYTLVIDGEEANDEACMNDRSDSSYVTSNCTLCKEGYYCPQPWGILSVPIPCGDPSYYCPRGAQGPRFVDPGHYSTSGSGPNTRAKQAIAPIGHYAAKGQLFRCPAGVYGNETGLSSPQCNGECKAGWYCPVASTNSMQVPCAHRTYCPGGSVAPTYVRSGFYTVRVDEVERVGGDKKQLINKYQEFECEAGYWCSQAVRYPCEGIFYGKRLRETNSNCTGLCEAGHWCRNGSTSPKDNKCGNPAYFCPPGSQRPTAVEDGFYSSEDDPFDQKTSQLPCPKGYWCKNGLRHKCPAGSYGNRTNLSNSRCDGLCLPGHFCHEGSTDQRQFPCGNRTVYCPMGSSSPMLVGEGKYSFNSSLVKHGDYKMRDGTMSWQRLCEEGYYCTGGEKYPCPEGTFGNKRGISNQLSCKDCKQGVYCPLISGNPLIHETALNYPCGGAHLYCPLRSPKPFTVSLGYYSIGGEGFGSDIGHLFRVDQKVCPKGSYCVLGRKYSCPSGRFGNRTGLFEESCSGFCPAGYFCEEETTDPEPCRDNSYSPPASSTCISCNSPLEGRTRCKTSRECCSH